MERVVIQELRHVLVAPGSRRARLCVHTAKAVWAKSASEMTPAGRDE